MRKTLRRAAAVIATTAAVAATGIGTVGATTAATWGCPEGSVCIYPQNADPEHDPHPTDVFRSYGVHRLSGQVGQHWVFNNRTDAAHTHLCRGYDGTNCAFDIAARPAFEANMTPINSITLDRP
ncbi:hypothetical protein EYS09_16265 [Streptomyces kasugaensis]|uniref:Peptidase inhibitor family I36 n=1 Tax=Streptomyces kasugaensis TaxID=1946 RepID=A0A4Q9HUW2_STRKA|nr:hypothetical protein [Streptomyces kasugaensis]TBO58645.1 hypothetical protein EYS09_16265 [Streptomyces kasugaensis]